MQRFLQLIAILVSALFALSFAPLHAAKSDEKTMTLRVPPQLVGRGYRLVTPDDSFDLDREQLTVQPSDEEVEVTLQAGNGLIRDHQRNPLDKSLFDHVRQRLWTVGIGFTVAKTYDREWEKIFQDGSSAGMYLDVNWRPSSWGLTARGTYLTNRVTTEEKFTSRYDVSEFRLGGFYLMAPFAAANGSLRRLHLQVGGGFMHSTHSISIYDDEVSLDAHDPSNGIYIAVGLKHPLSNNFWFEGSSTLSRQKIEFAEFEFATNRVRADFEFGGSYAF